MYHYKMGLDDVVQGLVKDVIGKLTDASQFSSLGTSISKTISDTVSASLGGLGNTIAGQFTSALSNFGDTLLENISKSFGAIDPLKGGGPMGYDMNKRVKLYSVKPHPQLYTGVHKARLSANNEAYDTPYFFLDGPTKKLAAADARSTGAYATAVRLKYGGYSGDVPFDLVDRIPLGINIDSVTSNLGKFGDLIGNRIVGKLTDVGTTIGSTVMSQVGSLGTTIAKQMTETISGLGSSIAEDFGGSLQDILQGNLADLGTQMAQTFSDTIG